MASKTRPCSVASNLRLPERLSEEGNRYHSSRQEDGSQGKCSPHSFLGPVDEAWALEQRTFTEEGQCFQLS